MEVHQVLDPSREMLASFRDEFECPAPGTLSPIEWGLSWLGVVPTLATLPPVILLVGELGQVRLEFWKTLSLIANLHDVREEGHNPTNCGTDLVGFNLARGNRASWRCLTRNSRMSDGSSDMRERHQEAQDVHRGEAHHDGDGLQW